MTESIAPGAITSLLRDAFRAHREQAPPPVFRPGQVVGRFEIVRKLGRGGFGVVYEAFDRTLKRAVAFKALRLGGDPGVKEERLLREAEAAAQLSHPNIVTLHDVGESGQSPYLVMELLRGRTVGERLRDGAVPPAGALAIALQVAKGIAHAHARGIVHRDLTPGNVFLCEDGQVKVLDFGMAAFGRHKLDGGTVAYMAPEQSIGATEDERTDVFALGVVLYEMIAGSRPFRDPADLTSRDPAPRLDLPRHGALADLVASMMAKDPRDRPRNCAEVLAALEAIRDAEETAPGARTERGSGRAWRIAAVVAPSAIVAALAIAVWRGYAAPDTPSPPAPGAGPAPPFASVERLPEPPPPPVRPVAAPLSPAQRTPPAPVRRATAAPERAAVLFCRDSIGSVKTPPDESGDGVLTVVADPFAAVYVNGIACGDTPAECRVRSGSYVVRAVHPQLGERDAQVRVQAGGRASWAVDFTAER